jgi:hypothetical protein
VSARILFVVLPSTLFEMPCVFGSVVCSRRTNDPKLLLFVDVLRYIDLPNRAQSANCHRKSQPFELCLPSVSTLCRPFPTPPLAFVPSAAAFSCSSNYNLSIGGSVGSLPAPWAPYSPAHLALNWLCGDFGPAVRVLCWRYRPAVAYFWVFRYALFESAVGLNLGACVQMARVEALIY